MAGWKVEVTGLRQLINALDEVDKKATREITKRITGAAKSVVSNAVSLSPDRNPVSNWGTWFSASGNRDLSFDPTVVASGFKVRRNNFRRRGVSAGIAWDVYQTNPGGAIFELLGRGDTEFVQTVADRFRGKNPRTLIPAYYAAFDNDPQGFADSIRDSILDEARKAGLV